MLSFLSQFQHKQEMRESKDEILIGEIVFAMTRINYVAITFHAHDDRQAVTFKPKDDPMLHSLTIILDRKTGDSAIGQALMGSKATLTFQAEVKNYMADPDDLLHMYKTDLKNMFKLTIAGQIKLNHQLNSVLATKKLIIDVDDYILKGETSSKKLQETIQAMIGELREQLVPYKKAN
ncbi:MAG: hypothetical protein HC837_01740 [Chloroflexaceae bacterium]|nr:hypothetical protein [Chloroflexaceae bacterium]